ncbi:MAG: MBL fold metallo-hydrolase [Candidatus Dadabacteria bacterium]|nr:MAG: MBL fold metallo-hydrolase [Candidatus Dadabacteria bacterium]
MMVEIIRVVVTPFQQNCRIIADMEAGECVIVDPGGSPEAILSAVPDEVNCTGVWLTHSHVDHCGGVKGIAEKLSIKVYGHRSEDIFREKVREICSMYGISPDVEGMDICPEPDIYLEGGEEISVGGYVFNVLHVPGHSPGHLAFYNKDRGVVLAGDVLFAGSIGRTDLPGGNHKQLLASIEEKVFSLPDDTVVMSGHGADTTVGAEKRTNPFFL